jgi:rhamnogalacturonan acetylesterase
MSGSIKSSSMPRVATALIFAFTTALVAQTPAPPTGAPPDAPPQTNVPRRAPLNPALPTIFIVGDSTASNGPNLGWGSHLGDCFDLTKVNVANRAIAGRSSRSYMDEGHWVSTLAEIKAGDFVLLQWGQNDGGDLGGAGSRNARGDLKGIGEETKDVPQTTGALAGTTETIHTFGWYNRKYIAEIRAKGATPMILSTTIRNVWKTDANGVLRVERDFGYDTPAQQIAAAEHIQFIDMGTVEADRLEAAGKDAVAPLFPIDIVHTSPQGADLNAQSVAIALEIAKAPVVAYLKMLLPIPPAAAVAK